jgi:hypothetical protein
MNILTVLNARRQATKNTRMVARNLCTAAREQGLTISQLRVIERRHLVAMGRL